MATDNLDIKKISVIERLYSHAKYFPKKIAFIISDGITEKESVNYSDLVFKIHVIADMLQKNAIYINNRALLLGLNGLDYICAFLGCLVSGVTVTSLVPLPNDAGLEYIKIGKIIHEINPHIIISTKSIVDLIQLVESSGTKKFAIENLLIQDITKRSITPVPPDTIALFHYPTDMNSDSKIVAVSHSNLMYNAINLHALLEYSSNSKTVTWSPRHYSRDILQTVFEGSSMIIVSPNTILTYPLRWLQIISHYKADICTSPNLGFELCVRYYDYDICQNLSLDNWRVAYDSGEPTRADTAKRFCELFSPHGFSPLAFTPAYGILDSTIAIAIKPYNSLSEVLTFDSEALEANLVIQTHSDDGKQLVSYGNLVAGDVIIINPTTVIPCSENEVGEILVNGKSIPTRYWDANKLKIISFESEFSNINSNFYYATGERGFFFNNNLFCLTDTTEQYAPASLEQARIWCTSQLMPELPIYNIGVVLHITSPIDAEILTTSLDEVTKRHTALRTKFTIIDGQLMQKIVNNTMMNHLYIDEQHTLECNTEKITNKIANEEIATKFNLETDLAIKSIIIKFSSSNYYLMIFIQSIIFDGWSFGIFFHEIMSIYSGLIQNNPATLAPVKMQFSDFVVKQYKTLQEGKLQELLQYWENRLQNVEIPFELKKSSSSCINFDHTSFQHLLGKDHFNRMTLFSKQHKITIFNITLTCLNILLSKYTNQRDVLVYVPFACRNSFKSHKVIGYFSNLLPIRTYISASDNFLTLMQQSVKNTKNDIKYQDISLGTIKDYLFPKRLNAPLSYILFAYQNYPTPQAANSPFIIDKIISYSNPDETTFKVRINIINNEELEMRVIYDKNTYSPDFIEQFLIDYCMLLEDLIYQPHLRKL
ncbi:MAG: AMP-binding protein [Gammaproteobacteria bacterium]|nr:AMP-binding protein [Gammaproteobacteria bacterium]